MHVGSIINKQIWDQEALKLKRYGTLLFIAYSLVVISRATKVETTVPRYASLTKRYSSAVRCQNRYLHDVAATIDTWNQRIDIMFLFYMSYALLVALRLIQSVKKFRVSLDVTGYEEILGVSLAFFEIFFLHFFNVWCFESFKGNWKWLIPSCGLLRRFIALREQEIHALPSNFPLAISFSLPVRLISSKWTIGSYLFYCP